jgi:selenocysteine lyase/cysteine desulfurase
LARRLLGENIRVWSGRRDASSCPVRIATHVYNDEADIDVLAETLAAAVTAGRAASGSPSTDSQ